MLITLGGCGMSPTAPSPEPPGGASNSSQQALISRPAAAADWATQALDPLMAPPERVGPHTVELNANVNGKNSSVLELAKVTLRVPKNAFQGSARINVTIPDPAKNECHLTITPASKNKFKTPVILEFSPGPGQDVRTMTIYWYDEAQAMWVPIPTTVDAAGQRLSAELSHFSDYKAVCEVVKKSGW